MNSRQLALGAVLVPFLALTAHVLGSAGLLGFYAEMLRSASTVLAGVDLTLSLGLILLWMGRDSRERGLPFAPYLALTLALGVAGPLAYLIHREARSRVRAGAEARA